MTPTTVHKVIGINRFILVVFYTPAHCWQFRIIGGGGVICCERKIYYTPEAAEKAGREWIVKGN
jgi:hypothetical protein